MFGRYIRRRLASFARRHDHDVRDMNEMLALDRPGLLRFSQVTSLAADRGPVPVSAWYAAKLAALIVEDCGPCT